MEDVESSMENVSKCTQKLSAKYFISSLMDAIDVKINGTRPWDIQIRNEAFYMRVLKYGALGLGESYMDKWWDCEALDQLFDKILYAKLENKIKARWLFKAKQFLAKFINFQTRKRAKEVAYQHYNIGNELFTAMLDNRMIYSCGYWKNAQTLNQAQAAKLDLICQKLDLKRNEKLLDIGCGWGGLAKFAAENYGAKVVGVTISQQQYDYARDYCKDLSVEIRLQDYRDIHETFDKVVSVGMFEHVGHLNYSTFMHIVHRSLKEDGLFLLHTIGSNETSLLANAWITKYIFPNGMLPSIAQISQAAERLFVMEDWQNFGAYYDNTLMAWHANFTEKWPSLQEKYPENSEKFYRMWVYYLLSCAGSFRTRAIQLWQIVFSKTGIRGGYMSPR